MRLKRDRENDSICFVSRCFRKTALIVEVEDGPLALCDQHWEERCEGDENGKDEEIQT